MSLIDWSAHKTSSAPGKSADVPHGTNPVSHSPVVPQPRLTLKRLPAVHADMYHRNVNSHVV